jgi:hypothetical protein
MDLLYDRQEEIPDDVRELLRDYIKIISPVKGMVEAVKLVFDRMPDCGPELRTWASETAIMCAVHGLGGISEDVALTLRP